MFISPIRLSVAALLIGLVSMTSAEAGTATTKIEVRLTPTAAARLASGKAKYEVSGTRRKFSTEGQGLPATYNGKAAAVAINGVVVGSAPIALGRFDLNRDSALGQAVPAVKVGDQVSVSVGGVNVLNGRF